jgi:hypothetical protein
MNRFLTLLAFLVLASSAFASSTTCPLPNSPYSGYLGGFSCVSGNLMFNNFSYSATPGSPSASAVIVTPITDTGDEGLLFHANWTGNMDSLLTFTVTALAGTITDLHLSFNGGSIGTGSFATVNETVCLDGSISTCGNPIGIPQQLMVPNVNSPVNDAIFFAGAHSIQVSKDISVFAAPGNSDSMANISFVTNTFSQSDVPEPLSLALFGSGLVALGLMRKRAKR